MRKTTPASSAAGMIPSSRLKTLLLYLGYGHRVSYYDDWRDAFTASPHFAVETCNIRRAASDDLRGRIDEFDLVVLLHGCNADTLEFFEPLVPALAERRRARVLSFVGNEFNSPYLSTERRNALFRRARFDIIATQLLLEAGLHLYADTGARIISVPHALNPDVFKPCQSGERATIDIGVKGYKYPPWLGDDERNHFISTFSERARELGLSCDIGVDIRVERHHWADFLQRCHGTISTEVGSWYISPNDQLINEIAAYLKAKRGPRVISNDSRIRAMARHLPLPVKSVLWRLLKTGVVELDVLHDAETSVAELQDRFFSKISRSPVYGKAVSSRHFDAIGVKTCQIMQRGRFNDILRADEHYIAVDPDFSNFAEAVQRFQDVTERASISERAYAHVLSGHTYAHRTAYVRSCLDDDGAG